MGQVARGAAQIGIGVTFQVQRPSRTNYIFFWRGFSYVIRMKSINIHARPQHTNLFRVFCFTSFGFVSIKLQQKMALLFASSSYHRSSSNSSKRVSEKSITNSSTFNSNESTARLSGDASEIMSLCLLASYLQLPPNSSSQDEGSGFTRCCRNARASPWQRNASTISARRWDFNKVSREIITAVCVVQQEEAKQANGSHHQSKKCFTNE